MGSIEKSRYTISKELRPQQPYFGRVEFNSSNPIYNALLQFGVERGINDPETQLEGTKICRGDMLDLNIYGDLSSLQDLTALLKAVNQAVYTIYPTSNPQINFYIASTDKEINKISYRDIWGRDESSLLLLNNDFVSTVRAKQARLNRENESNISSPPGVRTFRTTDGSNSTNFDHWAQDFQCKHGFNYKYQEEFSQASRKVNVMYLNAIEKLSGFDLEDLDDSRLPANPCYVNVDLNGGTKKFLNGELSSAQSFETYSLIEALCSRFDCLLSPLYYDEESASWVGQSSEVLKILDKYGQKVTDVLQLYDFKLTAFEISKPKVWIKPTTCERVPIINLDNQLAGELEDIAKKNGKNFAHKL